MVNKLWILDLKHSPILIFKLLWLHWSSLEGLDFFFQPRDLIVVPSWAIEHTIMNRDSTRAESGAQKCQSKVIFFWFWYRRRCGDGLQPQELLLYKTRLEGIIVKFKFNLNKCVSDSKAKKKMPAEVECWICVILHFSNASLCNWACSIRN